MHFGDEIHDRGDENTPEQKTPITILSGSLWQKHLRSERAILAVPADIPLIPVDNGIDTHQSITMSFPLGGEEPSIHLFLLFQGRAVGVVLEYK